MQTLTINRIIGNNSTAAAQAGRLSLSELEAVAGGKGSFWKGVAKAVGGALVVAAAVVAVVVAPEVTIPLLVTASAAGLAGAQQAAEGVVEAVDARDTWDDGSPTRGGGY